MAKVNYIQWNGENLQEIKEVLGDEEFKISADDDTKILDLRFKKERDCVLGYFAEMNDYIFKKDNEYMILQKEKFDFLQEVIEDSYEQGFKDASSKEVICKECKTTDAEKIMRITLVEIQQADDGLSAKTRHVEYFYCLACMVKLGKSGKLDISKEQVMSLEKQLEKIGAD